MKTFKFKKIDAFTTGQSSGNPAGAIYLKPDQSISQGEMLTIAKELKSFVNEVGYLQKGDDTDFVLRYYSSEKEVQFCGHATIAIMYELIKNSEELLKKDAITLKTNMGKSKVFNKINDENAVYISAPEPLFDDHHPDKNIIANALNIPSKDLHPNLPIRKINGGLWTLVVPILKAETIINLNPDFDRLKLLCEEMFVDVIAVVSDDVIDNANTFRSRVFPPPFGYLEDPATGSANSAIGYYMLEYKKWHGNPISIEQNSEPENYNTIKLAYKNGRVIFGGTAVTRVEGNYLLH